jgi:uroporphyrinogen-III synthase
MDNLANIQQLSGRTVLVSPNAARSELVIELEHRGVRVLCWPTLAAGGPDSYQAADEALENLFGYDWLVFRNSNSVHFLLDRFRTLGHEISELDAVRVCAAGEGVTCQLEESQIHVDAIPDRPTSQAIYDSIKSYVGGHEGLRGLNFLVPTAGVSPNPLQQMLEDAGGRVDQALTYRTWIEGDPTRVRALLMGGGIDCIAFANPAEVQEFAQVFDTNDLDQLLAGAIVCCTTAAAVETLTGLNVPADNVLEGTDPATLAQSIASG